MIIKPPKPGLGFGILGFGILGFGLAWLGCGNMVKKGIIIKGNSVLTLLLFLFSFKYFPSYITYTSEMIYLLLLTPHDGSDQA